MGVWTGPKDWYATGLPKWLVDRADRLGYASPTEARPARFFFHLPSAASPCIVTGTIYPTGDLNACPNSASAQQVQRRAIPYLCAERDVLMRAGTGSGKSLAFLLPMLANLDMVQRELPQALVVVPTRELGVQHVMLTWRLLGGNESRRMPGDTTNMWSYTGPRGVLVRGMFDSKDLERARSAAWLDGVSVVVGTPEVLAAAIAEGTLPLDCVDQVRQPTPTQRPSPPHLSSQPPPAFDTAN